MGTTNRCKSGQTFRPLPPNFDPNDVLRFGSPQLQHTFTKQDGLPRKQNISNYGVSVPKETKQNIPCKLLESDFRHSTHTR